MIAGFHNLVLNGEEEGERLYSNFIQLLVWLTFLIVFFCLSLQVIPFKSLYYQDFFKLGTISIYSINRPERLLTGPWESSGRLFEVGAYSRLGAYKNFHHFQQV